MTVKRLKELLEHLPDDLMLGVARRRGGVRLIANQVGIVTFEGDIPAPLAAQALRSREACPGITNDTDGVASVLLFTLHHPGRIPGPETYDVKS